MTYYQVFLSCENKAQGQIILEALLAKRLCIGGPILEGPAKVWWKGEVESMSYGYVVTYTREDKKDALVEFFEKVSEEEIPMCSCVVVEINKKFKEYIDQAVTT